MSTPSTNLRDQAISHMLDHLRNPLSMLGAAIAFLRGSDDQYHRRVAEAAARAIEAEIKLIERECRG